MICVVRAIIFTSPLSGWRGQGNPIICLHRYASLGILKLRISVDSVMRGMNLPTLPRPPSDVEECWTLYLSRIAGPMPFPEASRLLVAYMAWPNDEEERNRWMATAIAFFVAGQVPAPSPGQDMFQLFGGLRAVTHSSFSPMMEKLVYFPAQNCALGIIGQLKAVRQCPPE